jgi:gas vesicle protein
MTINWSDPAVLGGILGGAITAVATVLTTSFLIAVPIKKMRPILKANYLDTIAASLQAMATGFKANKIPTQSGHRLKENLKDHKEDLARDASEGLKNDIFRLESLADEAVYFDK